MTDLQRCAVKRLADLEDKKIRLSYLNEKLKLLEMKSDGLYAYNYEKVKVQTGINNAENSMIDNIYTREKVDAEINYITFEIDMIDHLLSTLPENEKLVLERFFIHREKYAVPRLIEELGYEQSQIYRIRTAAVEHLTNLLYGRSK